MRINHNIAALNTYNKLAANQAATSSSLEKLSSGLKINKAGDNAAGLAISEKMRGQIRGLDQAESNANDGISMIQTAEGGLSETHSILQRMRELAVQASNDTNTSSDRLEMQKEIDQLTQEITRISTDTEFNTKKLLDGSMGKIATQTGGTAALTGLQAVGTSLGSGSYTIALTDAGTNTEVIESGAQALTAADFGTDTADITVDTNSRLYGAYSLTSDSLSGGTANFTLTGPDGTTTTASGHDVTTDLAIGGFTFDFSSQNVTKNGTLEFTLEASSLDLTLSGDESDTITNLNYSGGTLNLGGFQFTLKTNVGATASVANYNVVDKAVKFQIGANTDQNTSLSINNMSAASLNVDNVDLGTQETANTAIETIDDAITTVSSERAKLGASQNRLEHTINNLGTSSENLTAAESQIRDVDMAKEMMEFTKNNILTQAAQSMLAQANQQPQNILQLLQ